MRYAQARREDPVLDVTPMIDVVFQLVLFFMVSTTFVTSPGIQVDLPRSSAQTLVADDKDVRIWVTTDGAVYVDDEPVDLRQLRERLRAAARRDADTVVVIKADQGVSHGRVVTVMDLARREGLSRLAISTDAGGGKEDAP